MLQYVFDNDLGDNDPVIYSAYDQYWDKPTLEELKNKYDIIFMTDGNSAVPVKIIGKDSSYPKFALGSAEKTTRI